ncbi:hypothetical protein HPO96_09800 [Kribbella sandramycini]|uniref:Uncharacterized protein n=1 Tax=Kribbella sandramycini TaxID=60450 RepID=A0A7Y4KXL9_9ACTN|nr:hypothetical protein [Kribbella sandramycini]MBB6569628.1 hypothetical protein [Kribbella sandramycini]NOL40537.1 hypothetical protein [Kribbella sandramycini]
MRDYLRYKAPWWILLLWGIGVAFVVMLIGRALVPSFFPSSVWGVVLSSVFVGPGIAVGIAVERGRRRRSDPTDQN